MCQLTIVSQGGKTVRRRARGTDTTFTDEGDTGYGEGDDQHERKGGDSGYSGNRCKSATTHPLLFHRQGTLHMGAADARACNLLHPLFSSFLFCLTPPSLSLFLPSLGLPFTSIPRRRRRRRRLPLFFFFFMHLFYITALFVFSFQGLEQAEPDP